MSEFADVIGQLLLVIGAGFMFLAGVGVMRFQDVFSRMHAAAKAPTLAVICIGLGTAISIGTGRAFVTVVLVLVLQAIAGPVGSHLLGRSIYRAARPDLRGTDELAPIVDAESASGDD